jgi:lipid-A-disaccharide synthase
MSEKTVTAKSGRIGVMLVAGEASGDLLGAKLVSALQKQFEDRRLDLFGCAGPRMREAGVEPVVVADDLSVVGLAEIGRSLLTFLNAMKRLRLSARERSPDVAVLIDFPEFNLKLARHLKKQGLTVVYYVSPQLWAWRKYRLSLIERYVDLLLAILPFEKQWYAEHGVYHVEYIGNPHIREVHATSPTETVRAELGIGAGQHLIALLPGSREREIARILPVMVEAAGLVSERYSNTEFVICAANEPAAEHCRKVFTPSDKIKLVTDRTYDVLAASDAAAITSGTATLEAAIMNVPMVVAYKSSTLNYRLLKPLIDVPHFALVNLIAGERLVTELIQNDLTASRLADEIAALLDTDRNKEMRSRLRTVTEALGHGGASERAAELIKGLVLAGPQNDACPIAVPEPVGQGKCCE